MVLTILLVILIGQFLLEQGINFLNEKNITTHLPAEFEGLYPAEKYQKSQEYLRENIRFDRLQSTITTALILAVILFGVFNTYDVWLRAKVESSLWRGLFFIGGIGFASMLLSMPFSLYETFVIEQKYGFNKSTIATFLKDTLLSLLLAVIIGGPVLYGLLWFFENAGDKAWIYSWITLTIVQLLLAFLAPIVIMPLFNKFVALPEGALRSAIQAYAKSQNFELSGIFSMDGSKRSSKANAYFTGFGKLRRVVLFDTLIEKQSTEELVAVLAHEIGHYKEKHIYRHIVLSILSSALMLWVLSLFLKSPALFEAFKMEHMSVYAGLVFFGFFYAPISEVLSLYSLHLSRKYEFEADAFAVKTYGHGKELISALKKLTVENLSNLHPHPLKVFFTYTHPPILQRIDRLKELGAQKLA